MNAKKLELLPCPFCGGDPDFGYTGPTYGKLWWFVSCENCLVRFRDQEEFDRNGHLVGYVEKGCFETWNTRHNPHDANMARAIGNLKYIREFINKDGYKTRFVLHMDAAIKVLKLARLSFPNGKK